MKKLLNIQKKLKPIIKDEENPFFKSKYADINSVLEVLRPILNEEGVVMLQPLSNMVVYAPSGAATPHCALTTKLIDAENGTVIIESTTPLPLNDDPQKMGAAITYYRRYALVSLFCLEQEDDDGNSISPPKAPLKPAIPTLKGMTPRCPICGGDMWDNREKKLNPKQPDFKCKDKSCAGVIWPPKPKPVDDDMHGYQDHIDQARST